MRLRQGRKVPRNLYLHEDDDPGGDGVDVGRVEVTGLAYLICTVFNAALPECAALCDEDCEAGPAHCVWVHEPSHKPGWHGPGECPFARMQATPAATGEEAG
jgi:hypothetical protein